MTRSRHRRQGRGRWLVAAAAALAVLVLVVTMAWADRDGDQGGPAADGAGDLGATATARGTDAFDVTPSPTPTDDPPSGSASPDAPPLTLVADVAEASRLEAVALSGSYRAGATLRVQVADGGTWSSYPLGVVVDDEGAFSTYVELGRSGRNRLRMVEPSTGTTSNEVVVTVG